MTDLVETPDPKLLQELVESVPQSRRSAITPEYLTQLMNISSDTTIRDGILANFVTHASVLQDNKYSPEHFMHCIAFVSFRLWRHSNKQAFEKVFPDKYKDWVASGMSNKDINTRVSAFATGKLVSSLIAQAHTPAWILHMPEYHAAVKVQSDVMKNPKETTRNRIDAANNLMTHLKKPDGLILQDSSVEEAVGKSELSMMRDQIFELAKLHKSMIQDGILTTAQAAKTTIHQPPSDATDASFEDIDPDKE